MTFPFSTHNYQLRFWMAAGGVDPDEDVRLVVLPPPYMVDSLANGQVDAFCVGAPWNSVAVDRGVGHILHFVSDILVRAAEKVLAVRQNWSEKNPQVVAALIRAAFRAAEFIEQPQNRAEAARILAQPERIGVDADVIQRTLDGRLKISPDGTMRESSRYLLVGREGAARPDPVQAAWLYAQMVRWGQTSISPEALKTAKAVFRPDLYDAALGREGKTAGAPDADRRVRGSAVRCRRYRRPSGGVRDRTPRYPDPAADGAILSSCPDRLIFRLAARNSRRRQGSRVPAP